VKGSLRIYESHVGISGAEQKVSSFQEFTSKVLSGPLPFGYSMVILHFYFCNLFLLLGSSSYKKCWI
jgi:hypothetical protein